MIIVETVSFAVESLGSRPCVHRDDLNVNKETFPLCILGSRVVNRYAEGSDTVKRVRVAAKQAEEGTFRKSKRLILDKQCNVSTTSNLRIVIPLCLEFFPFQRFLARAVALRSGLSLRLIPHDDPCLRLGLFCRFRNWRIRSTQFCTLLVLIIASTFAASSQPHHSLCVTPLCVTRCGLLPLHTERIRLLRPPSLPF